MNSLSYQLRIDPELKTRSIMILLSLTLLSLLIGVAVPELLVEPATAFLDSFPDLPMRLVQFGASCIVLGLSLKLQRRS